MTALLAAFLLASSAPGCHSFGPSVHCELAMATPVPVAAVAAVAAPPAPIHPAAIRRRAPASARAMRSPARAMEGLPSEEAIRRHVESLASISDCTGARVYARSVGAADLAEQSYQACIGQPSPLPVHAVTAALEAGQ